MNFLIKDLHKSNFLFLSTLCVFKNAVSSWTNYLIIFPLPSSLFPLSVSLPLSASQLINSFSLGHEECNEQFFIFCLEAKSHLMEKLVPPALPSVSGSPAEVWKPATDGEGQNQGQSAGRTWAPICRGAASLQPALWLPAVPRAALVASVRSPTFSNHVTESPALGYSKPFFTLFCQIQFWLDGKNLCSHLTIPSKVSSSPWLSQSKSVEPPTQTFKLG